jgi:hypothetical protein
MSNTENRALFAQNSVTAKMWSEVASYPGFPLIMRFEVASQGEV